jgi:hypothetical protein
MKEQHISSVGHLVAVEFSQVVLIVSPLHHISAAHQPGTTQSRSEAQHCETIGSPCSPTYGQWNHNHRKTGNWPPEHRVRSIEWHSSCRYPSYRRWVCKGCIYSIDICILRVESWTLYDARSCHRSPFVLGIAAHGLEYFPDPRGTCGVNSPVLALAHGCIC